MRYLIIAGLFAVCSPLLVKMAKSNIGAVIVSALGIGAMLYIAIL